MKFFLWLKRFFYPEANFCHDCAQEIPEMESAWLSTRNGQE